MHTLATVGATPRLTEIQKADPAVSRALNDGTVGGALLAGGIAIALLSYHRGGENRLAIVGAAGAVLGAGLVFSSRRTEKA